MSKLEFGWYLPSSGDTTSYAAGPHVVPAGTEMFDRVVQAAEAAGFEYLLVPVAIPCWEAWVTTAFMAGRSSSIRMLVAARPGYINPVMLAKMVTTFDQLTGGRIAVNLIAGQSEAENAADGIRYGKEDRYALMAEEVAIMKALWTATAPLDWEGRFHTLRGARVVPAPLQQPHPRFYLGGGSRQAWEISAAHADVHLFWGDRPETVAEQMTEIRAMAEGQGRGETIGFGMRLQIICRETEEEAWAAAHELVRDVSEERSAAVRANIANSVANQRVQALLAETGGLIAPNLWAGLAKARQGAGVAIVGNPTQCADVIQRFIEIGCHSFCLSGYLHDEEAERFGRLVRPILVERNPGRISPL
ncbi:LLM class flavin-dependent oxidoreductase [Roseococcus sp. SDR]|uniref:LLM class flavin-dependent oxidoreductase n=1 Tax=Roseococcus sp. SDR TaxID=2835532 RepID=UPI001BCF8CA7|nr:LLM class flavin-dependent oxidoreductase [Roseococcus sp. SDR]MBS7791760.1 LLM class flavin-dependent oxidoreductase [Roseococcus sp. SDR]MBV1847074.1 LLM class flavin-dependent oxidoreductase [Roseococcus sp. SDR]